jgi:hypothetical protein
MGLKTVTHDEAIRVAASTTSGPPLLAHASLRAMLSAHRRLVRSADEQRGFERWKRLRATDEIGGS